MRYSTRKSMFEWGTLAFLSLMVASTATGQTRVAFSDESSMIIDGTSNQSDWSVTADSLYGWLEFEGGEGGRPVVSSAELHVLAAQIVSNRSPIMDRLTRRALKASDFEEIVFELTGVDFLPVAKEDSFALATTGNLSIAGVTKEVNVTVGGMLLGESGYQFTGSYELKMTDYGMDPPTALFGALHTGDAVVVRFDLRVPATR